MFFIYGYVKFLALMHLWTVHPKIICINKSIRDQEVAPTEEGEKRKNGRIGDRNPGIQESTV